MPRLVPGWLVARNALRTSTEFMQLSRNLASPFTFDLLALLLTFQESGWRAGAQ